jgi:hypothetical protein
MATHQHHEAAGQSLAAVAGSSTKTSKRASTKRFRNEQWERRIEEDWHGHLESLRQCISALLIGNDHPPMDVMKGNMPGQE